MDALSLYLSPSTGLVLLGLVTAVSLALFCLGGVLDWGDHPALGRPKGARGAPRRLGHGAGSRREGDAVGITHVIRRDPARPNT